MDDTMFGDGAPRRNVVERIMADPEQTDHPDGAVVVGSRAQWAYREIRRRIVELEMPPGATFTEGALATALGMSKTPAREALSVLAAENYVDVLPQTGYVIRPVTLRSIHSTFDLHVLLAGRAAESVLASAERLDEWEAMVEARGSATDPANADHYLREYMRLRFTMAAAAENRRLRPLLARILHHHERLIRLCMAQGSLPADIVGSDRETLAAMRARQRAAAGDAARARLRHCREQVVAALVSPDQILDVAIRG
jgi:DNA-binding GntR family transcriptional regulator